MKIALHKLKKLANAIKAWRGRYDGPYRPNVSLEECVTKPNPSKRESVIRWLGEIGRTPAQIEADLVAIRSFKDLDEYNAWLKSLEDDK